jgi:hypothetical protein
MTHVEADPFVVESLVKAIGLSLERATIPDVTTPAEVLSAIFTTLDRTLRAMKHCQHPEDANTNAKEIARVLGDLLVEFGMAVH